MLMFCCTHSGLYRKTELVTPDFSSETMKARSQRYIFLEIKEKTCQPESCICQNCLSKMKK